MEKLVQKLKQQNNWEIRFEDYNRKNNLTSNPLSRLQDQNIESLAKHLTKISQQKHLKHSISWVSTQYQILEIVLNSIGVITQKIIQDFAPPEWQQVCSIFPYKQPLTIKYESIRMVQEKNQHRRRWCASQQIFLIEIVKQILKLRRKSLRKNKWNDVARQLFIKSEGRFFRQGKHCRERWLNHLHPSIQKQDFQLCSNSWSRDEDIKLLSFVMKKGKRWARIAKKFAMTRSQCMVKKRFYELINTEEQDQVSGDSLRNLVKKALDQVKIEMGPRRSMIKSNDKFQQEVDNNQRKCSISKETLKMEITEKHLQEEIKPKLQKQVKFDKCEQIGQEQALNSQAGLNTIQNYFGPQFSMDGRMQEGFDGYMGYGNYMGSQMSPFYSYYVHLMPQFQSSMMLNEMHSNREGFYRF